jgi:hypothetical protein
MKDKNPWKIASIFLFFIFLVLLVNLFFKGNSVPNNQQDIKQLTGITNQQTINSIITAIDNNPKHMINLCDSQTHCFILGRLG